MPRQVENQTDKLRALLNRRNAAAYLDISPYTLDRLVKAGKLTPIALTGPNGPLMFRVRDLNALIDKRAASRRPKPELRGNVFGGVR
jgi:hypothetical protein